MDELIMQNDTLDPEPERLRGSAVILDAIVEYSARDTIFHDIRNRRVYIYGSADLRYIDMHLEADYIEIDFNNNELFAKGLPDTAGVIRGHPVFTEGVQSFESRELRYNFETKRGRTIGVITEEADGYVHGHVVKLQPSREVHVSEGKYTTCDHAEPHFHIEFRRAKIIPDDKIVSSFAYLVIRGVPTPLFVPFGFFPNKRGQASGILIPSYGEARNRGFYLENGGFYWGINEYLDLSIRGDVFSRGSWALRLGSNYSVRYRYSGNLNLSYAINKLGEENLPGYERSRDFRIQWSHSQAPQAHPTRSFRASVNAGSSQASRFNPVSDDDYLSNTFSSNVSYSRRFGDRYNFSANLRHSQNTNTQMVDLGLPEISFSANRFHPFRRQQTTGPSRWYEDISVSYNMNARNELRIADTLLFTRQALQEFRNGIRHDIPVSYSTRVLNHFNLSTSINYNERWYFRTIRREWDDDYMTIAGTDTIFGAVVTDTIPGFRAAREFSVSSGLSTRLYGMMQFRRGPVKALRHVLTPNLGFSMRPDFAAPFWGYYREYYDPIQDRTHSYSIFEGSIYGGPPKGRSGNLSFSLANNLEMKVRNRRDPDAEDRKIVLIDNFTVSTGYDFARDSINFSDLRLSGRTRLWGNFDISYSSTFTPYVRNEQGQYINRFLWETDRRLLKLNNTSWALNFNYRLSSGVRTGGDRGRADDGLRPEGGRPQDADRGLDMGEYGNGLNGMPDNGLHELSTIPGPDYTVPWNLNISYSFNYNARYMHAIGSMDRNYIQNLSVRGDVYLTPKWRIGFRTGYDFDNKQLTYTSIDVYRDLHCWEMTFNWIPMGFRQSYNFTIRVKSSVLQDLKLTRRTHHLDRAFQ
ncbi:MAG: putative LPS assembly protein LptD [Bacteroidales bacterium]|nr:putative LPS assembly protein LptD [Bacteroidales bacterium]